ncbi:MAG: zinc ribbon domain-containing protein [Gammaproteobacteria bacterium]|nr:zinc ribbon domain-containing protein [Gammaproteobacteria bacterium]
MPSYEYRCHDCLKISETSTSVIDKPPSISCQHCGSENTRAIVSRSNVVLSSKSKIERLDPKYEKMVDSTMAKNPLADPDRLLSKMRDPGAGKTED